MNVHTENRLKLQKALGKLLGFEDGAEDVLEYLITIEAENDLSEYLDQLLGGELLGVEEFVQNIFRYKQNTGESFDFIADDDSTIKNTVKEGKSNISTIITSTSKHDKKKRSKIQARKEMKLSKVSPSKNDSRNKINNNNNSHDNDIGESRTLSDQPSPYNATQHQNNNKSNGVTDQSKYQQQQQTIAKKYHPSRGKAKRVCGCFGARHEPLTNCLYCGRISCVVEGYDFCPFCGYMVEEAGIESNDKAMNQKNRLLRFDRDFARRTVIIDDQCDYQMPTTWMTEDEKQLAEENQRKQLESLKRPKHSQMNLAI